MSDDLKNIIEAVLLVSDTPVTPARIQGLFGKNAQPDQGQINQALEELENDCEHRGIELKKVAGGYRYQTKEKYAEYLRILHAVKPPRMSRALLETLAIIAYRQPVSRGDIEEVRGVAVSPEIMQRLIERDWVKQVGVRDVPGRPALFGTTPDFLSYFGLGSLQDLPPLMDQRELGEIAGEMDFALPPEVLAALEGGAEDEDQNSEESGQEDYVLSDHNVPAEDEILDSSLTDSNTLATAEEGDQSRQAVAAEVPSHAEDESVQRQMNPKNEDPDSGDQDLQAKLLVSPDA